MAKMIEPVGFYVLVKPIEVEAKTPGGIYLPDSVKEKEQAGIQRGTIKAAGEGAPSMKPHVGKTAIFGRYAGVIVNEGGTDYRLIDAQDIRGVI